MNAKDTVDALLQKNRDHEKKPGPSSNNHIPMVLIALHRLGGSSDQMNRYVDAFDLAEESAPLNNAGAETITLENWWMQLGRGGFSQYVEFFGNWTEQTSVKTVLNESLPVLVKGVSSVAYHGLLRLSYALDYDSREEAVFALAYWAASFYPSPEFDINSTPVEPDALLADIVKAASNLQITETDSIDGRIRQVYDAKEIRDLWKPVRIPGTNPLERMSELILETFVKSHHFTLLHALTSCQAFRVVLPYLSDPKVSLSHYWHSICAAYQSVAEVQFSELGFTGVGQDGTALKSCPERSGSKESD